MSSKVRRHRRSERGAVAMMIALSMVMLTVTTALVLDFGILRVDRQVNKSAADSAAAAGVQVMDAEGTEDLIRPFRGGCAALDFLRSTYPQLGSVTGTWSTGAGAAVTNPCDPASLTYNMVCTPSTPATWAWFNGQVPGLEVNIKAGYDLSDGNWPEEALVSADGSLKGGCDQVAVMIERTRKSLVGSVATSSDLTTRIRSVARIMPPGPPEVPVALLLLERNNCAATQLNGTNTRILIKGADEAPGRIHSDSLGNGGGPGNCGTGSQIINSDTTDGIIAQAAPVGTSPGLITVYALTGVSGAQPAKAYDAPPEVLAEGSPGDRPTAGRLITRKVVDDQYRQGVQQAISLAKSRWLTAATYPSMAPASLPSEVKVVNNCTDYGAVAPAAKTHGGDGSTLYFNCTANPGNVAYAGVAEFQAETIYIDGGITLTGGADLRFPNAKYVYVRGKASPSTGINLNSSALRINDVGVPLADRCPDGLRTRSAQLVLGQGALGVSNNALLQLCNVTVLAMGDGFTSFASNGCVPIADSLPPQSSTSCDAAKLTVNGGVTEWTAPNETVTTPTAADKLRLEDLALWTEAAGAHGLGGSGRLHTAGVYMLPNAEFTLSGTAGDDSGFPRVDVTRSQFIVRRLTATGGATFEMAPDPLNTVPIPPPREIALVR